MYLSNFGRDFFYIGCLHGISLERDISAGFHEGRPPLKGEAKRNYINKKEKEKKDKQTNKQTNGKIRPMVLLLASGIGQTVWQRQLYALALSLSLSLRVCLYKSLLHPKKMSPFCRDIFLSIPIRLPFKLPGFDECCVKNTQI
jgi:hypothetical protein